MEEEKKKVIKAKMKLSFEVVLFVLILILVVQAFPFNRSNAEQAEELRQETVESINADEDSEAERYSRIENIILSSPFVKFIPLTSYPKLPEKVLLFDKTRFVEGEINEYARGTEFYLTFEYPGVSDFNKFGAFYENVIKNDGWELKRSLYAVNGSKTVFEDESIEVRSVTYRKKNKETEELFIREKVRIFVLK